MPVTSISQSEPRSGRFLSAGLLRSELGGLGFAVRTEETWDSLASAPPQILFIAPCRDTVPSLAGNAIYVLVEQLCTKLPHSCAIVARWPITGKPANCDLSHRILYYRRAMQPDFIERQLPFRLKMYGWGHELLHELRYAKAAGRVARRLGAKLIVVEDAPAFCPAVRSGAGQESRILLHQHCDKPRHLHTRTWRRLTKTLDGVLFVARQARETTQQLHGPLCVPQSVVYSGVDLAHYSPVKWAAEAAEIRERLGIKSGAKVLLFLGRLVADKGVAEAAEAFNLARYPDAHMIIGGNLDVIFCRDEQYLSRLRTAATESSGRIHIVGTIPQAEVPAYYRASDVVIVPSIGGEGLPKVIIEALAMGRPVIASERGGIWELLDPARNGWLLQAPQSPPSIADVLKNVFRDPKRLEAMSANILAVDRPRMSENTMIEEFAKVVAPYLSEELHHNQGVNGA